MTENIVHLVLARTRDAPPGLKGLSLFVAPAVLADGRRNGVSVLRLEEKMGMHASPTCQMAFDDAEAEMLGAPGEGLARMFTMMNAERLDVAVEGVGLIEVALQRARHHAAERRQGRAPGSDAPIDPISRHRDVQRMLLTQMALAQGCRVMTLRTAVELELDPDSPLAQFMTPVCKAFCTDAAVEAANLAIQVHGGYGYCREYRVEQILRDARITPIYEGTNGIQAMTLAGRLLHLGGGAAAERLRRRHRRTGRTRRTGVRPGVADALGHWRRATEAVRASTIPAWSPPATSASPASSPSPAAGAGWNWRRRKARTRRGPGRWRRSFANGCCRKRRRSPNAITNPPTLCADDIFTDI